MSYIGERDGDEIFVPLPEPAVEPAADEPEPATEPAEVGEEVEVGVGAGANKSTGTVRYSNV